MKRIRTILVTLILPIAWHANAVAATPERAKLTLEPHIFLAPDGRKLHAELGRLIVPENRTKTQSRPIELVFVRLKSTAPRPGGRLFTLPEGPADRE